VFSRVHAGAIGMAFSTVLTIVVPKLEAGGTIRGDRGLQKKAWYSNARPYRNQLPSVMENLITKICSDYSLRVCLLVLS
jgi:hypothetical protein